MGSTLAEASLTVMADPAILAIVLGAVVLAYVNGLHDASNAVSTTIATRALSERAALSYAAMLNLLGAALGLGMAVWTLPRALTLLGMDAGALAQGAGAIRIVLASALVAALGWELLTWWWGVPSSSWHAMLSAAVGAGIVVGVAVPWDRDLLIVLGSIIASPLLGGGLSFLLVHLLARLTPSQGLRTRHLRAAQTVSAGAVAGGHGLHDALLPMSVVVLALATAPQGAASASPMLLVILGVLVAIALAAGTLAGGHRIIRTLARRLTDLSTAQGLAAETATALVMVAAALAFGAPVSTSHTVTAGIIGSGVAVRRRSVRWATAGRIVLVWVVTPLVTALTGAVLALMLHALSS